MKLLDPRAHGAIPFWFWNGDQQEDEITRQMELASAGGFKGLTIHARVGNQTEYMSERWLALMRHSCEEARRLGLEIWLYDEEGFPSGTVGGRLQGNDPTYQQKRLCYAYEQAAALESSADLLAVFDAVSFKRVDVNRVIPDQELLVFRMACYPRYVDTLKRETVERFMAMTHEPYMRELKAYFGNPITHIYTDDLNSYLDRGSSLPWTDSLPEVFEARTGYDLLEHLPSLIEALPGREKVRLDFRGVVMDLFLSEFVAPMVQWCDEHGVRFTGHLSGDEGDVTKSVQRFGSAMAFYETEHTPGVDDFLCSVASGCYLDQLRNAQGHCPVVLFKQASSVANQLKDGACSCEVLTFLGWGASLWGQSALLNYELALGVNLMIYHALYYATGGVAKRDCPPSYFFQQPYWPQYIGFHDAIARSTQLLTRGSFDADTLVLHPMSSCWVAEDGERCCIGQSFETRSEEPLPDPIVLEESLAALSHELLKRHVGFEYGDEWLLAKHGGVQGCELRIGAMTYSTVIIPDVSNLLQSTVTLLETFADAGGRIIALNPRPDCMVDGLVPEVSLFETTLTPTRVETPEALGDVALRPTVDLQVEEQGAPVISHSRVVGECREHFVCNMSDRPQRVSWSGEWHLYDPVDDISIVTSEPRLTLPPFHAVHLLPDLPEGIVSKPVSETLYREDQAPAVVETLPAAAWTLTRNEQNLMLIDWCEDGTGAQFLHTDTIPHDTETLVVSINIPDPSVITAVLGETVTLGTIQINGEPLPSSTRLHPSSQDMAIVEAVNLFKKGENRLTFNRLSGQVLFEPFYLMGDFGVGLEPGANGMRPRLSASNLCLGDHVESGLPFYWGGVRYAATVDGNCGAEWLDCGKVDGVLTLTVNGVEVGCRYRAPYRFFVAEHLVGGANTIELFLFNTAQNLYGPHRRDLGVALHRCPRRGTGHGDYFLMGFGLYGPVTLSRPASC